MEQKTDLERLHSCHLIIAEEIKRICTAHGLKYYMIAGTLLGAVRHKGFIPWDDDMDIGMLREDYDKFLEIAKSELGEDFFLQTFETDKNFGLPFAKILLNGTVLQERTTSTSKAKNGIFIDVFPFDNVPDDEILQNKQDKKTYFLKRLLLAKLNYNVAGDGDVKKKTVYTVLKVMSAFLSAEKIEKMLEAEMKKYNSQKTEKIVLFGGSYGYKKESVKREWFNETAQLPFEETSFSAPAQYISYLEYFYGDYMKLPPEDKRGDRHNVLELDFGKYYEV